jgi:hypothetical protein
VQRFGDCGGDTPVAKPGWRTVCRRFRAGFPSVVATSPTPLRDRRALPATVGTGASALSNAVAARHNCAKAPE